MAVRARFRGLLVVCLAAAMPAAACGSDQDAADTGDSASITLLTDDAVAVTAPAAKQRSTVFIRSGGCVVVEADGEEAAIAIWPPDTSSDGDPVESIILPNGESVPVGEPVDLTGGYGSLPEIATECGAQLDVDQAWFVHGAT